VGAPINRIAVIISAWIVVVTVNWRTGVTTTLCVTNVVVGAYVVVTARGARSVYLDKSKQRIALEVITISIWRRNERIAINTISIQTNFKTITNVVIENTACEIGKFCSNTTIAFFVTAKNGTLSIL
jgi:hypothetical protein